MFSRVLFASDLTEASTPALRAALELGRRLQSEVLVLHVTQPAVDTKSFFVPFVESEAEFFRVIRKREEEAAQRVLAEQVDGVVGALEEAGVIVRTLVRSGAPAEVIPAVAVELGADLIVMGTHGRTGWKHAMLGSIAERVVRTATVPVLTVRGGTT